MGSRPRQVDIDAYNAWARRNDEAPWGAPDAAPAAVPAAPRPGAQSRIAAAMAAGTRARLNPRSFEWELQLRRGPKIKLSDREGVLTPAGHEYSLIARRMGLDNYELNQWREGLHMVPGGNSDYAYDANGTARFVRVYDIRTGQYRPSAFGRSYFRTHRSRFTVALPTMRLIRKLVGGQYRYLQTNSGDAYKYLTDEQIEDFVTTQVPHGFAALGVVPDGNATPEQQRAWISEALNIYVGRMPLLGGRYRQLTQFTESNCVYVYDDSREPTFDEEITSVRQDGQLAIELILNRPLRGVVLVPDEMYGKMGIFPVAWEEAPEGENCIENQLILAITKW